MNKKVIKLFLVCLILALSILDAPEYIRCGHIGLCEFLELHGHMFNHLGFDSPPLAAREIKIFFMDTPLLAAGKFISLKSDTMENYSLAARDNFFSILENLIISKEVIKNLIIFYIPAILTFLKFPLIPIKRGNLYLKKIKFLSLSIENSMTSPTLRLLDISVIRS